MAGFILRLKTWWQSADRTQRLITLFGGGSLIVLLFGVFLFASKPKMSLVFTNLSPADAGSVAMEIENMGIPVTFDSGGNVQVPSDKVAKVRASLAMTGKLPKGNDTYTSDELEKIPMFTGQRVETERLNAIKQGELAQSIEFFDGVDHANVKITPAIDSPFETEKKPAQANVTVSEKPGVTINEDQARAMANLVASAVSGLDKTRVTIFTRTGRALWDGEDQEDSNVRAANKLDLERIEARKQRDDLQNALNRMLGQGNAIAMVTVTLDTNERTQQLHKESPNKPYSKQSIVENLSSDGAGSIGGSAGNDPNVGTPVTAPPPVTSSGAKNNYGVTQKKEENALDITDEQIKYSAGSIKSMSVTVLVNKTDKIAVNPQDPNDPIVKLANQFLGAHSADEKANFTASVVAYPFDTTQSDAAKKAEESAASSGRMQQILSIIPVAALILVAFLVVRAVGKLANRPFSPMLAAAGGPSLPLPSDPGGALVGIVERPKALAAANSFVLPEIVKQKALEAGITEEQLQAAIEEAGDAGISVDDIPSIKSRVNVPLEQIKKMANERPEAVAMLIKSWLIEEGIRR